MMTPTIHFNGTSRQYLIDQYRKAFLAVLAAMEAVQAAAPNGRDYYPQGADAFLFALGEHVDRLKRLEVIKGEMFDLFEACLEVAA